MPRSHKPAKVSQAVMQRSGGKYHQSGNGHCCPKSPSGSHWWMIDSPDGKISTGVRLYCGKRRQFANTLDGAFSMGVSK